MAASEPTYPFKQLCELIPSMNLEEINATSFLVNDEADRYSQHDTKFLLLMMMHRVITLKHEILQKKN
jgi:hypothetical protein